jgi:hypothetical protein
VAAAVSKHALQPTAVVTCVDSELAEITTMKLHNFISQPQQDKTQTIDPKHADMHQLHSMRT